MNDLKVFSNEEFGEVRTVFENGEAWFCGKDVQNALEYSKSSTPSVVFGAVPEKWKPLPRGMYECNHYCGRARRNSRSQAWEISHSKTRMCESPRLVWE